jgi:hypothetical protein
MAIKLNSTGVLFPGDTQRTTAPDYYYRNRAIFAYGFVFGSNVVSMSNQVNNTGVVSTDTTGVGTARSGLAAALYGYDKGIFGYGADVSTNVSTTNLVSNLGVISSDTTGVGTARNGAAAAGYGDDKAIFGYGATGTTTPTPVSLTNKVSNLGVVATDTTGVGTARGGLASATYASSKAIFGYGWNSSSTYYSMTNLVTNTGGVATDTTGVGTARRGLAAASFGGSYGYDKVIFGYGATASFLSMTNIVSNIGVVATDTTGVGTVRYLLAAASYAGAKAIFGYGYNNPGSGGQNLSMTNLVSNTGVVATDTTGVGTARYGPAATGFGS